jgi:hypothetical protein
MKTTPKNTNRKDVQLHIDKAYKIIEQYLPVNYVIEVRAKLPKGCVVSNTAIYNVRKKMSKRVDVLNAMVEVALMYKKLDDKLKKTIK